MNSESSRKTGPELKSGNKMLCSYACLPEIKRLLNIGWIEGSHP